MEEPELRKELEKMQQDYEPLLAIERKLVGWSIAAGLGLTGLLVWISHTFFKT